ncbi:MAG: branched-chain amino acid ABC transporter permease [Acidimicrobiia bacterium]|nr:branched-chain amino acid ABC transporter permease [Acidimicrobiia bacterium]
MTEFLQLSVNGLMTGFILAIGAVGVTMVLGVLRLLHVAHGDTIAFGTYMGLLFAGLFADSLAAALVGAAVATALFAVVSDYLLWQPLRRRGAGMVSLLLASIGLALILRHAIFWIAGADPRQFPIDLMAVYEFGPVRLSHGQIIALPVALAGVVALAWLFARTNAGKRMRALSDDSSLAAVAGVNVRRTIVVIWAVSGALAGVAGVLQGLVQNSFNPNLGFQLLLPVFAVVVLGGIGSAYGALAGGVLLGFVMEVSTWSALAGGVPPSYKQVVAFAVLILMLILRPQGLLGRARLR